jgi:hypothetical protein
MTLPVVACCACQVLFSRRTRRPPASVALVCSPVHPVPPWLLDHWAVRPGCRDKGGNHWPALQGEGRWEVNSLFMTPRAVPCCKHPGRQWLLRLSQHSVRILGHCSWAPRVACLRQWLVLAALAPAHCMGQVLMLISCKALALRTGTNTAYVWDTRRSCLRMTLKLGFAALSGHVVSHSGKFPHHV